MTIGAAAAALISIAQNHSVLPMVGVMAGRAILAVITYSIGRKSIAQQINKLAMKEEEIEMVSKL